MAVKSVGGPASDDYGPATSVAYGVTGRVLLRLKLVRLHALNRDSHSDRGVCRLKGLSDVAAHVLITAHTPPYYYTHTP